MALTLSFLSLSEPRFHCEVPEKDRKGSGSFFSRWTPRVPPKNLLLIPSGHHAAIHVPDRSGDPARRVAQQEINDRTHVRRSAHATNRVKGVESRQRLADLFRLDETIWSSVRLLSRVPMI